ncbi:MAG: endolytic transglycosylase MltG [Proteobacteria bacterium]|nr:endolytic transglycosylase MltG [Pseudomonadota bacterium]
MPARPSQTGAHRRLRRALGLAALLVAATLLAALGWLVLIFPNQTGPGRGTIVAVRMAADASLPHVSSALGREGAVVRPRVWSAYAALLGSADRLRRGKTVLLRDNMTPRQILQRLARGYGVAPVRVAVPEGLNRFDIARLLERWGLCRRSAFLAASKDPALLNELGIPAATAEGYLFPDTYELHEKLSPREIARRMVRNGQRRIGRLLAEGGRGDLAQLQGKLGWRLHEVLTLASIVEKEARIRSEQALIAGVFVNRLSKPGFAPRRLQADPTVAYGCVSTPESSPACARFDGRRVSRAMLADSHNPFNTYRHEGLPPGPIANPGLSALRATLQPAEHDYYYFVARGDGHHEFSVTLAEHNAAVDAYRRRAR